MADLKVPRLNKFIVSGRIGNELELKYTAKGTPVLRFALANDRSYKDENDQWQTVTSWFECIAWNRWAETLANNANKGSAIIVEGRLDTRNWTDQNNVTRKSTEVTVEMLHFLEWKTPRDGQMPAAEELPVPSEEMAGPKATTDDLPF